MMWLLFSVFVSVSMAEYVALGIDAIAQKELDYETNDDIWAVTMSKFHPGCFTSRAETTYSIKFFSSRDEALRWINIEYGENRPNEKVVSLRKCVVDNTLTSSKTQREEVTKRVIEETKWV